MIDEHDKRKAKIEARMLDGENVLRISRPIHDADIEALETCCKALEKSSTPLMLRANLVFLWDRFIINPPKP